MNRLAEHLCRAHGTLLRSAQARLHNSDWASEAVAETLLAAWQSPPRFDDAERLRAWLHGVLRHKIVDQLRDNLGRPDAIDPDELQDDGAGDPMARLAQRRWMEALTQALKHLPERQAKAFWLREALGWSTAEICDELGVSRGHAFVLLHRARHELRQRLQAHRP